MAMRQAAGLMGLLVMLGGAPAQEAASPGQRNLAPHSQPAALPSRLSLDRIFSSGDLRPQGDPLIKWLNDSTYVEVRPATAPQTGQDLWKVDAAKGTSQLWIPASSLRKPGGEPLRIEDLAFSRDGDLVLLFTESVKVWRRNTKGEFYTYRVSKKTLRRHGGTAKPSTLMFAKLSPDGTTLAYVRDNNLYAERVEGGDPIALTTDGNEEIINGTFDWVYEEEFDCRDGFRWSPDSKSIAFWRWDTRGVPKFHMIDNTSGKYPKLITFAYPKTGEANTQGRLAVVDLADRATRWLDVPGDTTQDYYLPRMEWTGQGRQLLIQRINRLQNANDFFLADADHGRASIVMTDRDGAWVDVHDDPPTWLEKVKRFTFLSERDGWRSLYSASREGGEIRRITQGAFDIVRLVNIDEEKGLVHFLASPESPCELYLYRARLDGKGEAERVTPGQFRGWNEYQVSPKGDKALWTFSSFGQPPVSQWIELSNHTVLRVQNSQERLVKTIGALDRTPVEFFRVEVSPGVALDGWLMKPPGFDPAKKYPILFHVYGEPAGQTASNKWGGHNYLWHQYLAQQGYLVATMDNRGTNTPRGRDWRKSMYRKIGIINSQDQAAGVRELLKRPYIDPQGIAVWGWSGGGTLTLNLLFRHPELYKVGMSVASVPDMNLYDTIYQERYMGLPQINGEDYRKGSPIHLAHQLQGKLLLVHGTGDDNVHYQGAEKLIDALVAHNKPFAFLSYPNRSHSINEGKNTTRHLYGALTDFLTRECPPGPRP